MINFLPNDSFIHEAKLAKFQPTVVIQILIFIIILIATSFAQAIPIGIVMFAQVFTSNNFDIKNPDSIQKLITKVESSRTTLVAELISTVIITFLVIMLMYGKEASNRKQEIDRQHYTIPNQRPKDKHCGKI